MKRKNGIAMVLILAAGCSGAPTAEQKEATRIDRQLSELYRPLLALVMESRASIEKFMETKLKREYIFPTDHDLEGEELKLWLEQAEGDTMPRNERMCALIRAKRDLVDGPDLPASFTQLLEHQYRWREVHEKWKRDHVPYKAWKSPASFPKQLQGELEEAIEKLEKRRAGLPKPA
jgi:hypothetical protein